MNHLQVHINQDIERRLNKTYNRIPEQKIKQLNPGVPDQAQSLSSIDTSLSQNYHRV